MARGSRGYAPPPPRPQASPTSGPSSLFALLLGLAALAIGARAEALEPHIVKLIVSNNRESLVLFSRIEGAFGREVMANLREELPLEFDFEIRICRERQLWPDKLLATARLTHALNYDILGEKYNFTATYGGREIRRSTASATEAADWMSTIDGVGISPLSILSGGRRYYLQMRVKITSDKLFFSRNIFFFGGGGRNETGWRRSPIFGLSRGQRS